MIMRPPGFSAIGNYKNVEHSKLLKCSWALETNEASDYGQVDRSWVRFTQHWVGLRGTSVREPKILALLLITDGCSV